MHDDQFWIVLIAALVFPFLFYFAYWWFSAPEFRKAFKGATAEEKAKLVAVSEVAKTQALHKVDGLTCTQLRMYIKETAPNLVNAANRVPGIIARRIFVTSRETRLTSDFAVGSKEEHEELMDLAKVVIQKGDHAKYLAANKDE
jgi:hypothetical protein